jgi:phosphoribosylformimino-5-aminoimidazole carboxamide ribotide isomerase
VQIIPVIDIRGGIVVRAVAGERHRYKPLESRLTKSTEPAEVLRALQRQFEFTHCYVADLDAIEARDLCEPASQTGNRCALAEMARVGPKLVVDAGVRAMESARDLLTLEIDQVVVSSESWPCMILLRHLLNTLHELSTLDRRSITFSIDLKHGQLLAADPAWLNRSPLELIQAVIAAGVQQIIILDLAAVGTGLGIPTLHLCRAVKDRWPELTVISGGGVHSELCLIEAEAAGIDGLLIASALHSSARRSGFPPARE